MTELNLELEELISRNASDFEISKLLKTHIKQYLSSLDNIFNDTQGKDFFVKHTKKIDAFIQTIYKYLLRKHFGDYLPMRNSIPLTLIALGSYGREQLCVYSDVDIMLLYNDVSAFNLQPLMEELITIAWDSGLKLGSRVHEINELEKEVRSDITIKTSVLESRMIFGSLVLWYEFQRVLTNIQNYNQKEFILEKLQEHKLRLLKYPLTMQPNIKDGYGGMRESNMLFWMANVIYGTNNTKDLVGIHFTESEYKAYRIALEYIFRIRNALHLIAKKKLDAVNFDVLPELSAKLGYADTPRMLKERQCMSKLFESLHVIHKFSAVMIKKFIRPYLFDKKNITTLRNSRFKKNIYIHNNILYSSFNAKPKKFLAILKELNSLPLSIKGFDNSYAYNLSKTIIPNTLGVKTKEEIKLLLTNLNIASIMKLLYNSKLFKVVLPTAKKIINQPQFDGYHTHPVDIHTIKALSHVHNIKDAFILNTYEGLSKDNKALLNVMILFHDIGKGRGKDHHIVGENIFKKFAKSIGMSNEHITLVARIVRYHNLMTNVANHEDIYSQNTISKFVGLLQTKDTLDLLICHTYADISSVGKDVFKSSTSLLLRELYLQSVGAFENKELLKVSTRRGLKESTIKNSKEFQSLAKLTQKKILSIQATQLFLRYKTSDIINLGIKAKEVLTYTSKIENHSHLSIKIIRVDALNLGYLLSKLSFLDINNMNIFKLYDDKKFFEINFSSKVDEEDLPFINEVVENSFDMSIISKYKKPTIYKKEVIVDCNHTDELAQVKIKTTDQKGLFAHIAKILDDYNVEIQSAKIHTQKGKVNDLLLIQKNGSFCPNVEKILEALCDD